MSLILSLLLSLCSVGILAGRIYEILKLTNIETGFLITEGIALNPVLLGLFVLITICCGVLIFGREKDPAPFFSESSGIIADVAGVAFIAYGIMVIADSSSAVFMIAGSLALFLIGLTGLGHKAKDAATIILLTAFVAGMCLDVIIFDVYSIYYTEFMHKVLSYLTIILVIIAVLKNVYAPSKFSKMLLYISGFMCFAFSGMLSIAELICFLASGYGFSVEVVKDIALAAFGIYALDNALSVIPKKNSAVYEKENTEEISSIRTIENIPVESCMENEKTVQEKRFEDIGKMLYSSENTEKSRKRISGNEQQGRKVFKGEKTTSPKTEKIVYKKPK